MGKRIAIVQGHPDPAGGHFVHALAGAQAQPPAASVAHAQQALQWAQHLVIFYPLWLGDMPAVLKLLAGRSARVVVTMGMPALFYKIYYRSHSLKSLKRNILAACGCSPVRSTVIGMVEGRVDAREGWLTRLAVLGNQGS